MKSLKDILIKDEANAKKRSGATVVLAPGEYEFKLLGFVEEDTYSYLSVEHQGRKFNFFYNLFNKEGALDLDVMTWLKALSTIPVTPDTNLLDIVNSAIGCTYKIKVYNYVAKSGKNKGQTQHSIDFTQIPELIVNTITAEDLDSEDVPF